MSGKKPVITVIGSYAVGLTMKTKRFPTCGETLIGNSFQQLHGGKGSNQAIECARLGAEVNFIACLGKDNLGGKALELYKNEGVKFDYIKYSETFPTGAGFIMVDDEGNNIILLDFGANKDLAPEYIESMEDVIAGSGAVLFQMEIPVETVLAGAKTAFKHGVKTILNPAPFQPLPDEIWQYITILTPNEKEARLILGRQPEEELDIEKLGEGLLYKGIKNAVITLGGKGACIASESCCYLVPASEIEVVDTTGAGDTFTAALAVAIVEGMELKDAVRFAVCAAEISITKYGVIESMPYRDQVERAFG